MKLLLIAVISGLASFSLAQTESRVIGKGVLLEKTFSLKAEDCMASMRVSRNSRNWQSDYFSSVCKVKLDSDPLAIAMTNSNVSLVFPGGFADGTGAVSVGFKVDAEGYTLTVISATSPTDAALADIVRQSFVSLKGPRVSVEVFRPDTAL